MLRYRRDVGGRGAVGVVYTGRQGDEYQNHVGGLDGFFQLSPTKYLRFQASRSQTEYPDTVSTLFAQPQDGFGGNNFNFIDGFNNLNNHAIGATRINYHNYDTRRNFGDLDLTILPENPNFRFWFVPDGARELRVTVVDSQERRFETVQPIA